MVDARWIVLVLSAVALAGCMDDSGGLDGGPSEEAEGERRLSGEGEGDSSAASSNASEAPDVITKPVWKIGDSWTWTESDGPTYRLVVTAKDDSDYMVDTTADMQAFEEAAFDYANIGKIRAKDLAMSTPMGETSTWFDFPLKPGKEWSVEWYGEEYTVTAQKEDDGRFLMTARSQENGAVSSRFHYSEEVKWFDDMTFFDAEGEPSYSIDITHEPGYTGEYVRADVTMLVDIDGEGLHNEQGTFDFSGVTDGAVYGEFRLDCGQGTVAFGLGPLQNILPPPAASTDDGYSSPPQCPHDDLHHYGLVGEELDEGNWGYVADIASEDAAWSMRSWLAEYERFQVEA